MTNQDAISDDLSRRHRQIIEVLYEQGEASAEEIRGRIKDPPSNSAVRATLKIMESRGLVVKREREFRYLYSVAVAKEEVRNSAMQRFVRMFFNNSVEQAALALLGSSKVEMSPKQLERVRALIAGTKEKG
jgi:BlaI family penicillinase repressor